MSAQKQRLLQALSHANNYQEWLAIAQELDQLDGLMDWRASDGSAFFHENLIKEHIQKMQALRQSGDWQHLAVLLQESVYRHLGELNNPALYQYARSGTKYIVGQYLDEVEQVMRMLSQQKIPQMSEQQKLALFEQAERVYGRPALMLSGGAAFGIYHLGVTKALWEAQLLPQTIAGSSMGAIVAAAVCNRSDAELDIFYREQLSDIHRHAIRWRRPTDIKKYKTALDETQIFEHIVTNVGSATFLEAYQRSGRVLNISVSPTRTHQKPRLLNYLTAPNVLIEYAAQASCAIPYLFPPVALQAKSSSGQKVPYMSTETWIDGTIHGDLPKERLARLHNVNQTIVSQANPHVIPFITHKKQRGVQAIGKHIVSSLIHTTSAELLDISKHLFQKTPLSPVFNQAHAVAAQSYLGDINIQFPFSVKAYLKVIANPSPTGLVDYIRMGEQATWPQMAMIRDLTRISRVFPECIALIKQRILAEINQNVPK
ncbi:MAG: patatin-like phospholipase family protein [Agitococcus sp.]